VFRYLFLLSANGAISSCPGASPQDFNSQKRNAERAIHAGIAKRRNYADSKTASIKPRNALGHVSGGNADDTLQRARTLQRVRLA
jgi:hypothetical protein